MMIFKKRKKGSAIVEACFVFPVVVLSMVAVILIMETLFSHVNASSRLHESLLHQSGEYSETFEITPDNTYPFDISVGIARVKGHCTYEYMSYGFMTDRPDVVKYDSAYVIHEKRHMRVSDHVRN